MQGGCEINIKKLLALLKRIYNSEEHQTRIHEMDRFLKYYKGKYWRQPTGETKEVEKADSKESEIFANLIFSTAMTIAPLLTDNRPIWSLRAEKSFQQKYLETFRMAGESLWSMLDMDRKIFMCVIDALIMKTGILKVCFDPSKNNIGEVSVDVIDPRTFLIAPGYTDPWEAPWCGTRTSRSLWWIRTNYPDKGKKVKPDGSAQNEDFEGKENYEVSDDFATIYEVWIKDDSVIDSIEEYIDPEDGKEKKNKVKKKKYPNGRILVFSENGIKLDDKPYDYNHGKAPYIPLYDYVVPHEFWGMGEADQIETIVLEYNLALRKFAKWVRMWADPNWAIPAGCDIPPEDFKEKAPGGGQAWTVPNGADIPQAIDPGQFNQSAMQFISGLPKMLEEVSGVTDVTKGMVSKKQRQSALEISTMVETSYTRTRQRVRNVEWTIKRAFELIVEIMQQYYTETRTFSSKNVNNENEWFNVEASPDYAKRVTMPDMSKPREEQNELEKAQFDNDLQDFEALMAYIGDEDSIYVNFFVDIQTNSTLPMDKQTMANLFLRLFELGGIDVLSLLEQLQIPNAEEIVERLKQDAQQKQQPQAPPQGMEKLLGGMAQ